MKFKKKDEITLQDVLDGNALREKALVNELKKEEQLEKKERIDDVERDIKMQNIITQQNKMEFISEIKGNLGTYMKENPSKVTIIKKPFRQRVSEFFKNIFTKF